MDRLSLTLAACALLACAHRTDSPASTRSQTSEDLRDIRALFDRRTVQETDGELARALERAGLINLAFVYAASLRDSTAHRLEALEQLVELQERRSDDFLIPSLLAQLLEAGRLPELSKANRARTAWLNARIDFRKGKLGRAIELCRQVTSDTPDFARAQYLLAIALADPRFENGRHQHEAVAVLEALIGAIDDRHANAGAVRAQALLALGRLAYAEKDWAAAAAWYQRAAAQPLARAEALFELAVVRTQQRDWRGALALVQSEEVRGAGDPEAALIEATAAFYSGDPTSAGTSLARLADRPEPRGALTDDEAAAAFLTGRGVPPRSLRLARANLRLTRAFASVDSFERELATISTLEAWKETEMGKEFARLLSDNLGTMKLVAAKSARRQFSDTAEHESTISRLADVFGIEVSLAGRDLDGAISHAERAVARLPEPSQAVSELCFRLMALEQARAEVLTGSDAVTARARVSALRERILKGDPNYERIAEVRAFSDAP